MAMEFKASKTFHSGFKLHTDVSTEEQNTAVITAC